VTEDRIGNLARVCQVLKDLRPGMDKRTERVLIYSYYRDHRQADASNSLYSSGIPLLTCGKSIQSPAASVAGRVAVSSSRTGLHKVIIVMALDFASPRPWSE
jgi:hypothetical protein